VFKFAFALISDVCYIFTVFLVSIVTHYAVYTLPWTVQALQICSCLMLLLKTDVSLNSFAASPRMQSVFVRDKLCVGKQIAVYCENHTYHILYRVWQNAELLNVAAFGTYVYH